MKLMLRIVGMVLLYVAGTDLGQPWAWGLLGVGLLLFVIGVKGD